ncbi:MAG: DUF2283 domain-containing protein [Spirochaetaceae bacterium]|jgi:uncharacterized protein YuzE|nr:DUF2283 domain-containing protein [Spirochaetaceae bacterium]
MRFHYYVDTDSLYIDLLEKDSVDSKEVSKGVVLDFDEEGTLVGIDIDHASKHVDLNNLALESLPIGNISMTKQTTV